jgi:hypothetical protein
MIRGKRGSTRKRPIALAGALVAVIAMTLGAATAQAASQTFNATFDDAALKLPNLSSADILEPPNTATMSGTIEDTTGAFTVVPASFNFPSFTGTASGIPVQVDFKALNNITGTLTLATGAMTTNASNYEADVTLSPSSANPTKCSYAPVSLVFSTGPGTPYNGHTFTVHQAPAVTIDTGILAANWVPGTFPNGTPSSPNPPTGDCTLIDSLVTQDGGVEMGNGFDLTPPAVTTPPPGGGAVVPPATPKKKKCKKAKKHSASASKKKCKKKK